MLKKLVQYGGYLISAILITWLINPIIAVNALQIILRLAILSSIPISGLYLLNKIISLKQRKLWVISISTWLLVSICTTYWLIKIIDKILEG